MIDTTGLTKAQVLCALYNASKPQGMGFMHYQSGDMEISEAEELLTRTQDFDYLKGRVMKLDLSRDNQFDEWGYDRDNGRGAAQKAVDAARAGDTEAIKRAHRSGVEQAAACAYNGMHQPTRYRDEDGMRVVELGLSDVAEQLLPAVKRAKDANKQ